MQFEIGVQTANKETLKAIHRNPDLTVLKQKVAKIRKKRNIHQHLDLIVGLPYEDYASFRESYNTVYSTGDDNISFTSYQKEGTEKNMQTKNMTTC